MLLLEVRWCVDCEAETDWERPGGSDSPEGACIDCGAAIFVWGGLSWADLQWQETVGPTRQPAAKSPTPTRAVATPAA